MVGITCVRKYCKISDHTKSYIEHAFLKGYYPWEKKKTFYTMIYMNTLYKIIQ